MSTVKESMEWAKEKMSEWNDLAHVAADMSKDQTPVPVAAASQLRFENASFLGDVTFTEDDVFFHFFPTDNADFNMAMKVDGETIWTFPTDFKESLADAFLAVFKFQERLFWDFVPELRSWVVRCAGYGKNPLVEGLIENVLRKLKEKLET